MPNNTHKRNVDGLLSHAEAKREAAAERIDDAIKILLKEKSAINFNTVATLANVSKTTLYENTEYRARIEQLRQNYTSSSAAIAKTNVTEKGKDIIIAAKNKRIGELESEVARLSCILKRCYANEYDKY